MATTEDVFRCLTSRVLHLIVMPTEACNFRCSYCYETFEHGRMRPEVVRGVKHLLSRKAVDIEELTITWFGGEPLLAVDLIEDIMLHAQSVVRVRPRVELRSFITTNGWLLSRPTFDKLLSVGVTNFQVSFDGPRPWHDRTRVRAGGGATFDRIWDNLLALRDVQRDFHVLVRLHADRQNSAALLDFIDDCARCFGRDRRFELFPRPLSRFGGPNDSEYPFLEADEGRQAVAAARAHAAARGLRVAVEADRSPVCYATHGNSFVIRADGRMNKCTVALEHPMNQVGRLDEQGGVQLDDVKMRRWMRGVWSGDAGELRCPMRGLAETAPRESQATVEWRAAKGKPVEPAVS